MLENKNQFTWEFVISFQSKWNYGINCCCCCCFNRKLNTFRSGESEEKKNIGTAHQFHISWKTQKFEAKKKIYGNQLFLVYFDWVDDKHLDMTWVVCCFSTWNLLLLFVTLVLPSVHISIATCVADNFFLSAWKDKENTIDMSRTTEIFRKAFFF